MLPRVNRFWIGTAGVTASIGLVLALGPRVSVDERWNEPTLPVDIDSYLQSREANVANLRPGDEKSVVWLDPDAPSVTPFALVYLHGFSADRHEVEPLISELSRDLGANIYFARLAGHGRDGPAMGEATVEAWLDDAAEAVTIGGFIGERVVLVGTSTGGTLALWAASREEARERIAAVVLVSPNLGLRDPAAGLLVWPWGGAIARTVVGAERCFEPVNSQHARHWTTCYPVEALLPMAGLVQQVRSLPRGAVRAPVLVVYSPNDLVVDPSETERVMARIGPESTTWYVVDGSGDPEQHVVAGAIVSPETTEDVRRQIGAFLRQLNDAGR